ncbi:uncharacterized protein LOC126267891 [Schistocerca gregaria]|uniref:uncharacterized protein LOC126267891 n=1 Tax=Schistocerca gregaria TaxID=7010 RepID=UPI00211DABC8|nr:uncharacterized protein LOC126267891 [Schistocerca gregaria]
MFSRFHVSQASFLSVWVERKAIFGQSEQEDPHDVCEDGELREDDAASTIDDEEYIPPVNKISDSSDSDFVTAGQEEAEKLQINVALPIADTVKGKIQMEGNISTGSSETANEGTTWTITRTKAVPGRRPQQNTSKVAPGPITRTYRLCEEKCTENRGLRELHHAEWTISVNAIEAAISLMCLRGIYGAKNFLLKLLWSNTCGPAFFRNTMNRNKFTEILPLM